MILCVLGIRELNSLIFLSPGLYSVRLDLLVQPPKEAVHLLPHPPSIYWALAMLQALALAQEMQRWMPPRPCTEGVHHLRERQKHGATWSGLQDGCIHVAMGIQPAEQKALPGRQAFWGRYLLSWVLNDSGESSQGRENCATDPTWINILWTQQQN